MRIGGSKAEQQLIAELCHEINSPLAAIRNALYLSATRSHDPDLLRYLTLADSEISSIAEILSRARTLLGELRAPGSNQGQEPEHPESHRAAA